jgi:molybdopterin molybdotransferase
MTEPKLPTPPNDVRMRGFPERADVEAVRRLLDGAVRRLPPEEVPVTDCAGRVLARRIDAPVDVPGFDRAAMDGFAVVAEDSFGASPDDPLPLSIAGESRPGHPFDGKVEKGQAVRIMTGAPVPSGADAVIPAEVTREERSTVQLLAPITPGKNVGRRGGDVRRGAPALAEGRRLRPQDAGLLSSLGVSPVPVIRRPHVDLLITGDELLPPGSRPSGASIVDSNSVMLSALVRRDGGVPAQAVRVPDTERNVRDALQAAGGDVVIVSGGSSVGREDHAPRVLAKIGQLAVHGIAMRPASPAGIGFLPDAGAGGHDSGAYRPQRPVLLLPGNPVSCLCAYDFFAGPAIRKLAGLPVELPYRRIERPLAGKVVSMVGRVDYLRVRLADERIEPLGISGAAILSSTVQADGFVIVPRDAEGHAAGETVEVYLYDAPAS